MLSGENYEKNLLPAAVNYGVRSTAETIPDYTGSIQRKQSSEFRGNMLASLAGRKRIVLFSRPGQSIEESISKASTNLIQQRGKRGFDVL